MACSGWDFALKKGTLNSPSSYKQAKKLILSFRWHRAFPQCLDTHSQEACHSDKQTRTWKMKWCHNSGMHISSSLQLLYNCHLGEFNCLQPYLRVYMVIATMKTIVDYCNTLPCPGCWRWLSVLGRTHQLWCPVSHQRLLFWNWKGNKNNNNPTYWKFNSLPEFLIDPTTARFRLQAKIPLPVPLAFNPFEWRPPCCCRDALGTVIAGFVSQTPLVLQRRSLVEKQWSGLISHGVLSISAQVNDILDRKMPVE